MSEERYIYPYNNGQGEVFGDPMALEEEIWHELDGDLNRFLRGYWAGRTVGDGQKSVVIRRPDESDTTKEIVEQFVVPEGEVYLEPSKEEERYQARKRLRDATIKAFKLTVHDERTGLGLKRNEIEQTLWDFLQFLADSKKKPDVTPSCSPSTAHISRPALTLSTLDSNRTLKG